MDEFVMVRLTPEDRHLALKFLSERFDRTFDEQAWALMGVVTAADVKVARGWSGPMTRAQADRLADLFAGSFDQVLARRFRDGRVPARQARSGSWVPAHPRPRLAKSYRVG